MSFLRSVSFFVKPTNSVPVMCYCNNLVGQSTNFCQVTCKVVCFSLFNIRKYSQTQQNIQPDEIPDKRILKIAIVGTPNAGKSTFINQIVGRRVLAISNKVHTTRGRARAVINLENTQVVFVDTPGLVSVKESDKYKLESSFLEDGEKAMTESNVVAVIHDVSNRFTRGKLDQKVLRLLHLYPWKHSILILNKVDAVKKKRYLLELADRLTKKALVDLESQSRKEFPKLSEEEIRKLIKDEVGWAGFHQLFMVSALEGSGVSEVMEYLLQFSKPGNWMFPENSFTDLTREEVICESVKSRLLDHLPHQVPYICKVKMELLNQLSDGTIMGVVLIISPDVCTEKVVLRRIRTIAQETEAELRSTFMTQVLIKLVVQTAEPVKT